ncbi:MAG: glycosyltransferase family 4 protein [Candidatus Magasanikbacteria bacterium]|nr:glycosyltransferase family 4 protein [Candidatus Magasanikbacteria bacterium]
MKQKILIFSTAYLPMLGGAEIAVKEITDRIFDFEFVLITARLDKTFPIIEQRGNVEIHRMGKGNFFDKFRLVFGGAKYVRRLGHFSVIWAIMASYGGFAALRYKKQNPEIPFLLTLQEGDSRAHIYSRVWFLWPWFKQIFRRASALQAISGYLLEWGRIMGFGGKISALIPNGVDLAQSKRFQIPRDPSARVAVLKNEFGCAVSPDDRTILTVSRLARKNGVDTLIRALAFLPFQYKLIVAGSGKERAALERLSKDLKCSERVFFLGNVAHESLPRLYASSDVFCRLSRSEGLGNVFLEAMAAGIPVVATSVGGIPDIVRHEVTGILCSPGKPKEAAEAIARIMDNVDLRENCVKNARNHVSDYDWNIIAYKMKELFNKTSRDL